MRILLIFAAVTFAGLPRTNTSLVSYDCSDAEFISTISLQDILTPCNNITQAAARKIRVEIYEVKGPKTVLGYRCQIRFKQSLVDWRGSKRVLPMQTVVIGRDACLKAHKSGYLDLEDRIPHLDPNGTTRHSLRTIYPDVKINQAHFIPGYHDHYYERDYEITLSQHSGSIDFQQDIVHFDNGVYCDFSHFSCVDDRIGVLLWTSELQQKLSTSIFGGEITLFSTNETLVTPKKTYAVMQVMYDLVSLEVLYNVTISGKTVFRTEHPDVYIEPITKLFTLVWSHYKASKLYEYVNLTNSYNSRYDSDIALSEPISHFEIAKRFCLKEGLNLVKHCNSSSDVFETTGCVILLPRKGMIGVKNFLSGAHVKKCAQKIVYTRESSECFHEIPVKDDQYRNKFLDTVSRMLVDSAEPIACDKNSTTENYELVKNSTDSQSSVENTLESKKTNRSFRDWLLLVAILFLCTWGLFGIIQLALLISSIIKKHRHSVSRNEESSRGCQSVRTFLPSFEGKFPKWKQRVGVQETDLSIKFTG